MENGTFDLSQFSTARASEGSWMRVTHPVTRKPLEGWRILLAGMDSRQYRQAMREQATEALTQNIEQLSIGRSPNLDADEIDARDLETVVNCTLAWEGIVERPDQSPLEFSRDNARRLYNDYPFLREQAAGFIRQRANFLSGS